MKVWSVPFHVIENEWTDDQYYMMIDRLGERLERENPDSKKRRASTGVSSGERVSLTLDEFLEMHKPKDKAAVDGD